MQFNYIISNVERTDNNYHKADILQTSVNPVVSFQMVVGGEFLPANVALVTQAQVVSVNVVLQVGLGRVRLVAVRAMVLTAFCYEK